MFLLILSQRYRVQKQLTLYDSMKSLFVNHYQDLTHAGSINLVLYTLVKRKEKKTTMEKIHINCGCTGGSNITCIGWPKLVSFASDEPPDSTILLKQKRNIRKEKQQVCIEEMCIIIGRC